MRLKPDAFKAHKLLVFEGFNGATIDCEVFNNELEVGSLNLSQRQNLRFADSVLKPHNKTLHSKPTLNDVTINFLAGKHSQWRSCYCNSSTFNSQQLCHVLSCFVNNFAYCYLGINGNEENY